MRALSITVVTTLLLAGCGSEPDSSEITTTPTTSPNTTPTSTPLTGKDFSGSYRHSSVVCLNNAYEIKSIAVPSTSSSVSTLIVYKNEFYSTSTGGSCTVRMSGRIVFTESSAEGTTSYGTLYQNATAISVTGATTCTISTTWEPLSGYPSLQPSTSSSTWSNSSAPPTINTEYLKSVSGTDTLISIPSVLQVTGRPTDVCFLVYVKT